MPEKCRIFKLAILVHVYATANIWRNLVYRWLWANKLSTGIWRVPKILMISWASSS